MADDGLQPQSGWVETASYWATLAATVIAVIALAAGNRVLSLFFTLLICLSADLYLWRRVSRRFVAATAILVVTVLLVGWVGLNIWTDSQNVSLIDVPNLLGVQPPDLPKTILMVIIPTLFLAWLAVAVWQELPKTEWFRPARSGELLIIVGKFDQRGGTGIDPTTRIVERLNAEFSNAHTQNSRIERAPTIGNEKVARRIGQAHRAIFVVWGWYDAAGFSPHFTITRESPKQLLSAKLGEIPTELRDFNLYIREGLPAHMSYLATFTVGQLYYWDAKYNAALRAFEQALANLEQSRRIEGTPTPGGSESLYFYQSYIHGAVKGNPDRAIADSTEAIKINPQFAQAFINRSCAYGEKGEFEKAIADSTLAIKVDPKYAKAYYNRGLAYQKQGALEQAIADYNEALKVDPQDAWAYSNRGAAYADKGEFEKAIADYNEALKIDPKQAAPYNNRGEAYQKKGDLKRAIRDYSKALKIDPQFSVSNFNRGVAYREKGLNSQAIMEFDTYLRLAPSASNRHQVEQWINELKDKPAIPSEKGNGE